MAVHVKLSTTLRDAVPAYNATTGLRVELAGPTTVEGLARSLGLPLDDIKVTMVNGVRASFEQTLAPDDRVAFFPAVGGG